LRLSLCASCGYDGAETFFNIKLTEAVFGLITIIVLFNIYTFTRKF